MKDKKISEQSFFYLLSEFKTPLVKARILVRAEKYYIDGDFISAGECYANLENIDNEIIVICNENIYNRKVEIERYFLMNISEELNQSKFLAATNEYLRILRYMNNTGQSREFNKLTNIQNKEGITSPLRTYII